MRGIVLLVVGLAGGVAGGLIVHLLRDEPAGGGRAAPRGPDAAALARLEERVARLEARRREPAPAREPAPGGPEAAPAPVAGPGAVEEAEDPEGAESGQPVASAAEFVAGLKGRKLSSSDIGRMFSWLSLHPERIPGVIAELQAAVEAEPNDPELHVALATAYVAELANTKVPGPQQGIVWAKASQAYDAAIALEPEHWQARYGKAFGLSMAPEFLGMRPEAIRQFEQLRKIQEGRAPQPHFAQTYFRLGTLYKDAGNAEKAREIWDEGLRLFPDNEVLRGTLEASTKK